MHSKLSGMSVVLTWALAGRVGGSCGGVGLHSAGSAAGALTQFIIHEPPIVCSRDRGVPTLQPHSLALPHCVLPKFPAVSCLQRRDP